MSEKIIGWQVQQTHLEMSTRSFMVCTATSLSLSRVMETIRSWNTEAIFVIHVEHFVMVVIIKRNLHK